MEVKSVRVCTWESHNPLIPCMTLPESRRRFSVTVSCAKSLSWVNLPRDLWLFWSLCQTGTVTRTIGKSVVAVKLEALTACAWTATVTPAQAQSQ
jgi:hypothetical protein